MSTYTLEYKFRQRLDAPAKVAYAWCTDFEPGDGKLFPVRWERSVRPLSENALILTDTTYPEGRRRRIHRLIRLNPFELTWTNTHLDGPYQHSQYLYRIGRDGSRRSHLEFYGSRLITSGKSLSRSQIARLAAEERRGDSGLWRTRIAPALKRELATRRHRS
jgi:hypothetical protein